VEDEIEPPMGIGKHVEQETELLDDDHSDGSGDLTEDEDDKHPPPFETKKHMTREETAAQSNKPQDNPANCTDSSQRNFIQRFAEKTNVSTTATTVDYSTPNREIFLDPDDGSQMPINYDMHNRHRQRKKLGHTTMHLTPNEKSYLDLLKILGDANAPIYLFDQIVGWAFAANRNKLFESPSMSREVALKQFTKNAGVEAMWPEKTQLTLPNAKAKIENVRMDPMEAVLSLMSDSYLMKKEKLDMFQEEGGVLSEPLYEGGFVAQSNDDAAQVPDIPGDHVIRDVYSAHLSQSVYHARVKLKGKETVIGVIFFVDKTHIDTHGRLCQEPICITLTIFNKKTRADPRAWRVIGYIPNQSMHATHKVPRKKLEDYHHVLQNILKPLQDDLFGKGGVYWEFSPELVSSQSPKSVPCLIHFYCSFLTGDNEGHDKICGHYGCRTSKCPRLCRRCDTLFNDTDDPYVKARRIRTGKHILNYNKTKGTEKQRGDIVCNAYGFHKLDGGDAFTSAGIDMGVKSHISTRQCIDIMHTERKGIIVRAIDAVRCLERGSYTINKDLLADEAADESRNVDAPVDGPLLVTDDDGKQPAKTSAKAVHIFSLKYKTVAEKAMTIWGVLLQQQSDRSLSRTYFPQGALSTQKLNCHEYIGLLLLYDIFFLSTIGDQMMGSQSKEKRKKTYTSHGWLGSDNMSNWVATLEGLLLLDTFLAQDEMLVSDVMTLRKFMPRLLDLVRYTINRKEGNGMKTLKFHLMLHMWEDILKCGVPGNTDTEIGESNHKDIAKKTANRTQKRSKLLDWQTAIRYIENLAINILHSREFQRDDVPIEPPVMDINPEESENTSWNPLDGVHYGGWTHCFDQHNMYLVPRTPEDKLEPKVAQFWDEGGRPNLSNELKRFLTGKIAPHCQPTDYEYTCMFNYVKKDGAIYRAAPGRKPTRNINVGWNDWAYVRWDAPIVGMMELEKTATGGLCRPQKETGRVVTQEPTSEEYMRECNSVVPAHLLCFVRIVGVKGGGFLHHGRTIQDGLHMVCHAVTQKRPEPCEDSLIVKHVMKDKRNDNFSDQNNMNMYLLPIANIVRPCVCVPNVRGPQRSNDLSIDDAVPHRVDYLLIEARERWPSIFLEHMKSENEKPRREWDKPWHLHNAKEDTNDTNGNQKKATGTKPNKRKRPPPKKCVLTEDVDDSDDDSEEEGWSIAALKKAKK
jgi:hypothetical protein